MRARLDPDATAPERDPRAVRPRATAPEARELRNPRRGPYVELLSPRDGR